MLEFIKKLFCKKKVELISAKELSEIHYKHFSGRVCNLCGEPYVGLAQDCRCTNYGE